MKVGVGEDGEDGMGDSHYREILDAIPLMVFVVDDDVVVLDANRAAMQMLGAHEFTLRRRGGELLHCIRAVDVPAGCGHGPACSTCVVRNSVKQCAAGAGTTRKRTRMTLQRGESRTDIDVLVTTSPMVSDGEPRVLLVLEDITEITQLRGLIPICMKCKSVRNDEDYWQSVENFFQDHAGVEFSHGICPKCMKEHYSEYAEDVQE